MSEKLRKIFIGDIHGCAEEFQELIKTIEYNKETDQVILLGDLISRGPLPIETITKIRELEVLAVQGNHDLKLANYLRSNKPEKHPLYYDQLSDEDKKYILSIPAYIEIDNVIAMHAGMKPGISLSKQGTDLQFLRYTDKNRKFISLREISKHGIEKLGAHFWTEFGPFYDDKNIFYGHQVHSLTDVRIDEFHNGTSCIGLDTGCVFGGALSCAILDATDKSKPTDYVQIKAKQEYFKPTF